MKDKLRVGILGAGWAGGAHAIGFSRLPDVEVSAIWSRTRARAETVAGSIDSPNLKIYDHWQDLIESGEIDILSLATPPTLRIEPFTMALERGCHVLVEKPVSVGMADSRAMVEKANQADIITATCFNWRYTPGGQTAIKVIEKGKIGSVLDIRFEIRFIGFTGDFLRQRPWTADYKNSSGIIGEGLVHDFDRTRYFTACEFKRVVSRFVSRPIPLEPDYEIEGGLSVVLAELSGEVLGNFRITFTAGLPDWSIIIDGERGILHVTHEAATMQLIDDEGEVSLDIDKADRVPDGTELQQHTWNRLISDFVFAIRKGDKEHADFPILATLEDGLRAQEVVEGGRIAEKEQRWVELAELG
jgi:predicted dehydrogenase